MSSHLFPYLIQDPLAVSSPSPSTFPLPYTSLLPPASGASDTVDRAISHRLSRSSHSSTPQGIDPPSSLGIAPRCFGHAIHPSSTVNRPSSTTNCSSFYSSKSILIQKLITRYFLLVTSLPQPIRFFFVTRNEYPPFNWKVSARFAHHLQSAIKNQKSKI